MVRNSVTTEGISGVGDEASVDECQAGNGGGNSREASVLPGIRVSAQRIVAECKICKEPFEFWHDGRYASGSHKYRDQRGRICNKSVCSRCVNIKTHLASRHGVTQQTKRSTLDEKADAKRMLQMQVKKFLDTIGKQTHFDSEGILCITYCGIDYRIDPIEIKKVGSNTYCAKNRIDKSKIEIVAMIFGEKVFWDTAQHHVESSDYQHSRCVSFLVIDGYFFESSTGRRVKRDLINYNSIDDALARTALNRYEGAKYEVFL
jgi:hypothetical protein